MSFPPYTVQDDSGPGILYVNSKIKDPTLSSNLFTKWYEQVHIPHIFETKPKGISSAFRYYSVHPSESERPYLALYPLKDVKFLQTDAFRGIPVHSDLLPGNGPIFHMADFDTRYYTHMKTVINGRTKTDTPGFVVTVCYDADGGDGEAKDFAKLVKSSVAGQALRISTYKNYFTRQNRLLTDEKKLQDPPKYLAVLEFKEEVDIIDMKSIPRSAVAEFRLLGAFGDKNPYFE